MPRNVKPVNALQKKTEVEDAGRTATFRSSSGGKGQPGRVGPKNVYLAGLPGSGKNDLAKAAAARLGMRYADLDESFAAGGIDELVKAVSDIAAGAGVLAAMPVRALGSQKVRDQIAGSGIMVYLMADMPLILTRFAKEPERAAREGADSEEELRAQFAEFEPLALGLASAILRAENEPGENVDDLVDKLKVMGGRVTYDVHIKEMDNT